MARKNKKQVIAEIEAKQKEIRMRSSAFLEYCRKSLVKLEQIKRFLNKGKDKTHISQTRAEQVDRLCNEWKNSIGDYPR